MMNLTFRRLFWAPILVYELRGNGEERTEIYHRSTPFLLPILTRPTLPDLLLFVYILKGRSPRNLKSGPGFSRATKRLRFCRLRSDPAFNLKMSPTDNPLATASRAHPRQLHQQGWKWDAILLRQQSYRLGMLLIPL
jgi:hypothetical protein